MRLFITAGLYLAFIMWAGEAWQLAPAEGEWHPTLLGDYYDTPQWVVKEIAEQVKWIAVAMLLLTIAPHRVLRPMFFAFLIYTILDTCAWFIDHKRWEYYWWVYLTAMLAEITGYYFMYLKPKR